MSDALVKPAPAAAGQSATARLAPYGLWIVAALLLILLPQALRSGTALTMMGLMGIAVVFALSYNILLGQTGMLSFGHSVFYGLGAYYTVHAMNAVIAAKLPIPLPLMPLVGGVAGLIFAWLFGWVATRRSGTAFAMISLGVAELVGSSSLILRSFFGGEEGVSTNRTRLLHPLGLTFGPQIQVYYLIAAWCLVSAALIFALTRTPFGRMCNAVRDNPQRTAFIGYDPRVVRHMAFAFSGLFAGLAGGLAAINFELANSALFGAAQSGTVLLATFIGGARYFIGPILGAVLVTYLQTMLSDVTEAWQLYFGLMFIAAVMYAPGGLAGLVMRHGAAWRAGTLSRLLPAYGLLLPPLALAFGGAVLVIEMATHRFVQASEGPLMTVLGFAIDSGSPAPWAAAALALAAGALLLRLAWPRIAAAWDAASPDGGRGP